MTEASSISVTSRGAKLPFQYRSSVGSIFKPRVPAIALVWWPMAVSSGQAVAGIDRALRGRVLDKLGVDEPSPDMDGLRAVYAAWCRSVPFDNVRKLIHIRSGESGPLPGDDPGSFFTDWLSHGCGGTCWAGNGALYALLSGLGFDAQRAVATMLVAPDIPPNHGSVRVRVDGQSYIVDASILHGEPLPMIAGEASSIDHPTWGVTGRWVDEQFRIAWRNFITGGQPMDCGFNSFAASAEDFSQRHEITRTWSPFNFGLSVNLLGDDRRIGAAMGSTYCFDQNGSLTGEPADLVARQQFLIEEVGMSEELVSQLPDDLPMAPPPG